MQETPTPAKLDMTLGSWGFLPKHLTLAEKLTLLQEAKPAGITLQRDLKAWGSQERVTPLVRANKVLCGWLHSMRR